MSDPKVSVIVLTYKHFSNLENNIRSICSQNYDNYEVIINDDASPDFDEELVGTIVNKCGKSDRIRVCRNEVNAGTVRNYLNALQKASGEIIVPLSQDDCFAGPDTLRIIADHYKENGWDACYAKRRGSMTNNVFPDEYDARLISGGQTHKLFLRLILGNFISGSALYYRREYVLANDIFDTRYRLMEDYPAVINLIKKHARLCFLDHITIIYGEDGVSGGSPSAMFINDNIVLTEQLDRMIPDKPQNRILHDYLKRWKCTLNNMQSDSPARKYMTARLFFMLLHTKIKVALTKKDIFEVQTEYLARSVRDNLIEELQG